MSSGQEVGAIFGDGTGPAAALLRSPTVIIASIALWGMNVCLFRLFGIDYIYVLLYDLRKEEEEEQEKLQQKKKQQKLQQHKPKLKTRQIQNTGMKRGGRAVGGVHTEIPTTEAAADEFDDLGIDDDNNNESQDVNGKSTEIEMSNLSMLRSTNSDDYDSEDSDLVNISLSPSSKEAKTTVISNNNANFEINEVKLIGLAGALIITLYLTSYFWIQVGRGTTIGAIFCFYILVLVGIILPLPSTNWIRLACKTVFVRAVALLKPRCSCLVGKPRSVPFIDVFFADGMCSMSKVCYSCIVLNV